MPPNILRFLDGGLAQPGRWRVPLVLRLDSRVSGPDVTAVLTAVVNHHDALRMRLVNRAGMGQHIAAPGEFTELTERTLPADAETGTPQEREALRAIVAEALDQDLNRAALTAHYVVDAQAARASWCSPCTAWWTTPLRARCCSPIC